MKATEKRAFTACFGTVAFLCCFCFGADVTAHPPEQGGSAPGATPAGAASVKAAPKGMPRECYIRTFRAKIAPERIRVYLMPSDGEVANWLPDPGRVKKDTIIATVNEEEVELERKELEVKLLKERIAKEEELLKLERQRDEVKFYASLSKEERKYAGEAPNGGEKALKSIEDKIKLINKELEMHGEKPRLDFRKKEEKYILRMPFDGRLQYQFSFPQDDSVTTYLDSGTPIATVCDDSAYYITIAIADPDLTNLPPETLSLRVQLGDGTALNGVFAFKRVEKNGSTGGDLLAYFFRLPKEQHDKAHDIIGSNCMARLYYTPRGEVVFLNKMKLASTPEGSKCSTWQELLSILYPDWELVVNGETELIVRKK